MGAPATAVENLAESVRYGVERGIPLREVAELLALPFRDARMLLAWDESERGRVEVRARVAVPPMPRVSRTIGRRLAVRSPELTMEVPA